MNLNVRYTDMAEEWRHDGCPSFRGVGLNEAARISSREGGDFAG